MRRRWIGLALGALTIFIFGGSIVRSEDIGCCEAHCRTSGPGGVSASVTVRDTTRAECENPSPGCDTTWRPEVCATNPGPGVPYGVGGEVRDSGDQER
jgi:hypothetical protein